MSEVIASSEVVKFVNAAANDSDPFIRACSKALQFILTDYSGEEFPLLFSRRFLTHFMSFINAYGQVGFDGQKLYVMTYMLLAEMSMTSDLLFENDFIDLRDKLRPAEATSLTQRELSLVVSVIERVKKESNYDDVVKYLNDSSTLDARQKQVADSITKLQALAKQVQKHESAFNFVALYNGFQKLRDEKQKELEDANQRFGWLSLLVALPLLIKFLYSLFFPDTELAFSGWATLAGLELVLIYFFRVNLQNLNSIKGQLIQIDLRRTLCQFIQDYASYSASIGKDNPGALEKFESLIFSGIVTQDEKIPSTFDGLDTVQKLLESLRPR